jgi:hypothetical protein
MFKENKGLIEFSDDPLAYSGLESMKFGIENYPSLLCMFYRLGE